jgi:hypothetical protein
MSLSLEQIEHHLHGKRNKSRKWLKKQRNKKIRLTNKLEIPFIKYKGWEY